MQTEEICRLLERELRVISRKACGSIDRVIMKTLLKPGISLEDMGAGNGSPGASRDRGGVSVL